MSFVHIIKAGFFGTEDESAPGRDLELDECVRLLTEFGHAAPDDLKLSPELPPRGSKERGYVLAFAERHAIMLKKGVLNCPYFTTSFILPSIVFVAFVHMRTGCSIYSPDSGEFMSLEEFVPRYDIGDILRQMM